MPLRHTLSVACLTSLALAPLPAMADDTSAQPDIARRLSDPGTQAAVTVALTALSQALLDFRIGPISRAMAAAGDNAAGSLPADARLRDLAGPEADRVPGEIGRRVPQAMGEAAGMVGALQDMLPEFEASIDRMKASIPKQ
jgi:hypothetical protein